MKAFYRPQRPTSKQQKQIRQRVKMDVDRYLEAKKKTMSDRICAMVCITLSFTFGFGPVRLKRFWDAFQADIKTHIQDMEDTEDGMLFLRLRQIGMGHLADIIQEDYEAEKEVIKDSVFDTGGTEE